MTRQAKEPAESVPVPGTALVATSAAGQVARSSALPRPFPDGDGEEADRRLRGGLSLFLHAFRRRWPLAISLGLGCALAAMVPAWLLTTDKYTAVSLLQISASQQTIVFPTEDRSSASSFEVYKGTQQQLLTSDVVLISALRKPGVSGLSVIQKEDDPVRWLAKNLRVDYPGNAEIMRVSLTGNSPDEVAVLVRAVVEAYMNGAGDAERREKREHLKELETLYTEKSDLLRTRRTQIKQLTEELGTGDPGALSFKRQIAQEEYAEARNELIRLRTELQRARDDVQIKEVWLKRLQEAVSAPQPPPEPEPPVEQDPEMARLIEKIQEIDDYVSGVRQHVMDPAVLRTLTDKFVQAKAKLEKKVAERRKELAALAKRIRGPEKKDLAPEIAELKARIAILDAQEKAAAEALKVKQQEILKFDVSSIDVMEKQSELAELERIVGPIAEKRDKLSVELSSMPRISVFQPAEAPKSPDAKSRTANVGLAGGGSFLAAVFLVLWWDVRKQRINSLSDLSSGMGLRVVGAVPLLPRQVLQARRRVSKRHRRCHASLNHAVDGIVARLFLRKNSDDVRVALVTSAAQAEGKTMLAVNLAKRLARTGERTLLVDLDLRRPSLHRIFGVPRGPGVGECLEGTLDPLQVVSPTDTENLSLITAGSLLDDPLGPLSNGVTTSFFEKVRGEFKFVIVDGSPILPVIDGLLASQHADTVIVSVRRDTSEAPQVLRACEKLSAFAAGKFVVVLNGSHEESYGPYQEQVLQARVEAVEPAAAAPAAETAKA